ncbi:MAG: tRNA-binding protein [Desulfovibrio sp.]
MSTISWEDFEKIDIRIGTVLRAEEFPEARNPSFKVWVDFGEKIGIKKTSAQITDYYDIQTLVGRQVVGVVNFPPRQIGPFMSEFLLTGFYTEEGGVVLAAPERTVQNGAKFG